MSATSQSVKFNFGGFFKQMFHRSGRKSAPPQADTEPAVAVAPSVQKVSALVEKTAKPANSLAIPVSAVLANFPLELRSKIRQPDGGGQSFLLPVERILPQLGNGVVKVRYGEIRRAFPVLFAPGVESDPVEVALPLNEILSRLNPSMLPRRSAQKKTAIPDEIASPFAGRASELKILVGNANPAPIAPTAAGPAPVTSLPSVRPAMAPAYDGQPAPRDTSLFRRSNGSPGATAIVTPAKEPIFARKPALPTTSAVAPSSATPGAAEARLQPAGGTTAFFRKSTGPVPPSPQPPAPAQVNVPAATSLREANEPAIFMRKPAPSAPEASSPAAAPAAPTDYLPVTPAMRNVTPAKPAAPAAVAVAPTNEVEVMLVPLAAVSDAWPEAVLEEIVPMKLADARLALPVELVKSALLHGRVIFPWKRVRSWLRPMVPLQASSQDATEVELPLAVIAPLFIGRQQRNGKSNRVSIDESIPNLFFGLPKAEPPPTPKPTDTNYYDWGTDVAGKARTGDTQTTPRPQSGTDMIARQAAPSDIVARAAALPGVAGAVIALPDGLMVASRVPAEYNPETLAAFLPQIFAKVSHCTNELRMGDLNNLNFTVGNVPWKIFRVNAIYFAALGLPGQQMPSAELVALAAELDRRR